MKGGRAGIRPIDDCLRNAVISNVEEADLFARSADLFGNRTPRSRILIEKSSDINRRNLRER
jgi:hypothetical protein